MTNLEHAQEIADEARKRFPADPKIQLAAATLDLLIQENRELRAARAALSDSMDYSLPGGRRA